MLCDQMYRNHNVPVQYVRPSPVALEPLSRQKAAVLTLVMRLPTGDDDVTPSGQSGIALASTLVTLGRSGFVTIRFDHYRYFVVNAGNPRKSSTDHQKPDKGSKGRKSASNMANCV